MNIDDMPAGREMDALIAEKVMGWHSDGEKYPIYCFVNPTNNPIYDQIYVYKTKKDDDNGTPKACDSFSRNISAAWEVVEKMNTSDLGIELISMTGNTLWICHLYKRERGEVICDTSGTAPLAICRAALKAVEEK